MNVKNVEKEAVHILYGIELVLDHTLHNLVRDKASCLNKSLCLHTGK